MTLPDDRPDVTRVSEAEVEAAARAILRTNGASLIASDEYWPKTLATHRAMAEEHGSFYLDGRSLVVNALRDARAALKAAAQARSGQEGEFQPTATEIAREQDAYCKGYAAAKALCSDPATTKAEERVKALEGVNERLREVLRVAEASLKEAKKQIVVLAQSGTERLRDYGHKMDDAERTYSHVLHLVDEAGRAAALLADPTTAGAWEVFNGIRLSGLAHGADGSFPHVDVYFDTLANARAFYDKTCEARGLRALVSETGGRDNGE